jgi:hypothetical protein
LSFFFFTSGPAAAQTAVAVGIASASAFGTATLSTTATITPTGLVSASAIGTPTVVHSITVAATSISSGEAFGTTISVPSTVSPFFFTGTPEFFGSVAPTADNVNISEQLRELLVEHGREIFVRQKTLQRCSCWNEDQKEADLECASCSGFGWVYVDKRALAFKRIPTQPTGGAYRLNTTPVGMVSVDEAVFYMETITQKVYPSVHDWIVECRTKTDGSLHQPYLIERAWDVNEVVDLREFHSNLSYYTLRCRRVVYGK